MLIGLVFFAFIFSQDEKVAEGLEKHFVLFNCFSKHFLFMPNFDPERKYMSKTNQKRTKNEPKTNQKRTKNEPKMNQKRTIGIYYDLLFEQ